MAVRLLTILVMVTLVACSAQIAVLPYVGSATTTTRFKSVDAVQGVAVDEQHIYVIGTSSISKHRKADSEVVQRWLSTASNTHAGGNLGIIHLNGALIRNGRLYATHSNWPHTPIRNVIEVWAADTLEHIASHSLPIDDSYITWFDRYRGFWWAAFADYPGVSHDTSQHNFTDLKTRIVRMDDSLRIIERFVLPDALLQRHYPVSNSGASWSADGCLYLTGHDRPELYIMRLPTSGDTLDWIATLGLPGIEGQDVAWDRGNLERII